MKTSKKTLSAIGLLSLSLTLLSWKYLNNPEKNSSSSQPVYLNNTDQTTIAGAELLTDFGGQGLPPNLNQISGAEDVLVKRIPGDNNHILIMAYYSKENFSAPSLTIQSGSDITFRDDGKGYDEKAGDGLYTAKVTADVSAFKKQALSLLQKMKENNYRPYRYIHRKLVYDPDASETFDTKKFDANQAVSISGITNSLSADVKGQAINDKIGRNSVFITDLGVVEDPDRTWNTCAQTGTVNGAWTFGELMRQLASKDPQHIATDAQLSDFVKNWLTTWTKTTVINGDTVKARTLMNTQILTPWLNKSQSNGAPQGQLDMHFSPFKLTAILNRFDLRAGQRFGIPNAPCGESRFIFCLIKSDCTAATQMTIIFEYGIHKTANCDDQKAWAQQWFNLKDLNIGSNQYNQALQAITDQFTLCGTNTTKPNQSSLDKVRTNEIILSPNPRVWELREYALDNTGSILKEGTVAQTPADKYDAQQTGNQDVARLAAFINQNKTNIMSGNYLVPLSWQSFSFLGACAHVLDSSTGNPPNVFHWDGSSSDDKSTFVTNNSSRSNFSLQTCNGCHGGETQTHFTHVDPAFYGTQAGLSGFLAGKAGSGGAIDSDGDSTNGAFAVKDAALRPTETNTTIRAFNDINRRAQDLKSFVNTTCGSVLGISSQLMFQPVNMVH